MNFKNYPSLFLIIILFSIIYFSCDDNENCIIANGESVQVAIADVNNMSGIITNSVMDVNITKADSTSFFVSGSSNLIPFVAVANNNGIISINLTEGCFENVDVVINATTPALSSLDLNGTGDVTVSGFENLDQLQLIKTSTGNVSLSGSTQELIIDKSGTGSISAFGFESINCEITQSGTGDTEILVIERLFGSLSGTGDILYKGNPEVDIDESGTGTVIDAN